MMGDTYARLRRAADARLACWQRHADTSRAAWAAYRAAPNITYAEATTRHQLFQAYRAAQRAARAAYSRYWSAYRAAEQAFGTIPTNSAQNAQNEHTTPGQADPTPTQANTTPPTETPLPTPAPATERHASIEPDVDAEPVLTAPAAAEKAARLIAQYVAEKGQDALSYRDYAAIIAAHCYGIQPGPEVSGWAREYIEGWS